MNDNECLICKKLNMSNNKALFHTSFYLKTLHAEQTQQVYFCRDCWFDKVPILMKRGTNLLHKPGDEWVKYRDKYYTLPRAIVALIYLETSYEDVIDYYLLME